VDLLETRIRAPAPGPGGPELEGPELEVIEELEGLLVGFAREAPVQKLLARAALDRAVAVPVRRALLRAMARSGVKEAPAAWTEALAALIAQRDDVLIADAVAAARRLAPVSDSQPPEAGKGLASPLLDLARDPGAPPGLRLEALAAAPGELRGEDLGPETFLLLLESLDPETPVAARSAATSVLVRTALDPREKLALIARLRTAGPLEVNALLPAFEKLDDEALALELILALEASPGGAGLRPDALAAWLEKAPAPARERGARLLAALDEDREAQRSQLEALAAGLQRGDVRRGQRVFQSPRAACASCHAVGYLGGRLGPDLTGIGKVRSERDLLESILYPSMSFVRSYEPLLVVSREGEAWNGILRADTPEELVLATGAETEVRIPRAAILEVRPGTVSVMPAGVEKLLTPEEIADLVAFLKAPQE
jgi:putative heme-binding domain-containing protein